MEYISPVYMSIYLYQGNRPTAFEGTKNWDWYGMIATQDNWQCARGENFAYSLF
jgi:hypothetical protein